MKNIALATMLMVGIVATSFAQDKVVKNQEKVKKTSTAGQKVHNVFHKHHKHYSGYKVKHVKKVEKVQ
ncbi:MAG: hypothetical protein ACTHNW_04005 [Mucilaginibacter sp.]